MIMNDADRGKIIYKGQGTIAFRRFMDALVKRGETDRSFGDWLLDAYATPFALWDALWNGAKNKLGKRYEQKFTL